MFKLQHSSLISHASKGMLKILQLGFNSMWNKNFQMYNLDLEKAEEPEIKLPTFVGSQEFQKTLHFCFIDYAKAFDCADLNIVWKIL